VRVTAFYRDRPCRRPPDICARGPHVRHKSIPSSPVRLHAGSPHPLHRRRQDRSCGVRALLRSADPRRCNRAGGLRHDRRGADAQRARATRIDPGRAQRRARAGAADRRSRIERNCARHRAVAPPRRLAPMRCYRSSPTTTSRPRPASRRTSPPLQMRWGCRSFSTTSPPGRWSAL